VLGMYYDKKFWLLRLRNIKVLDKAMADNPPEFRNLDVSILNHLIFTGALGLDLQDNARFSFSPDVDELIRKADSEQASISFFLNPVRMQQIMALALKGNKMPPKSTYFYPKVLSGLVINRHGDS